MATESTEREAQYLAGFELGTRWAQEHSTLRDLRTVARLEGRDLSVELGAVPSLFAFLEQARSNAEFEPDAELADEGDWFSAGLIGGAADVYRTVMPYLSRVPAAQPTRRRGKDA